MRESPEFAEVKAAWVDQPEEEIPVNLEEVYTQRTWELLSITRSEVLGSVGAALFFAIVVGWRFAPERDRSVELGCAAAVAWVIVTLFRFRVLMRRSTRHPAAFAVAGLEHYRLELARRRDHLRSAWVWHGPLWLALVMCAVTLARRAVPGRLWDALPVVVLLAAWSAMGVMRRLRQAAELQHEIDELAADREE